MPKKYFSFLLLLLSISLVQITPLEDEYINSFEELQDLVNTPQFIEYLEEKEIEESELKGLFSGEECLMPKSDAVKVLQQSYGVTNNDPDKNLRFILGKCNPLILIGGLYSTKLNVEFNCKGLSTEERILHLKKFVYIVGIMYVKMNQ